MVEYKLYYFNFRGRGELIRWVLAAAGQKYEDIRFEREKWPEYKAKSPTGQSPFIEIIDGTKKTTLAQSATIARYLARKFGLAGKNESEMAEIEMYGDQITDLFNEMAKLLSETDETRKAAIQQKLQTEILPNNMKLFEARLAKTGSGYLAASGLTWVDLYLTAVLEWLKDDKEKLLEHFKLVKALENNVRKHPKIADWLAKRPVTEF